ncbi:hypothetical protein GQ607_015432 [Colletotrichum asianum]|uniref:Uncharacterized protein n=1 Tax=Colletotrichum asianum TaxID=702518 RepID=A0A8H3ZMS7_9PEZI|nr:hypothetical protein GQ607_015432 [Colletotrichum asianum]
MMRNEESRPSQSRASTLYSRLKAKFTCNTKRPSINPDGENDMLAAGSQVEKQSKSDSDLTKTLESDEQTSQMQQGNTERRVRRRNIFTKSKSKSIVPNDHNNDNESEEKNNSKRSKSELDNRRKKEKAKIRTRTVSPTRYSDSGSNYHSDAINAAILASITGIPHHGPYNFGNMFSGGDDGGFGGGCDTGSGGCDSGGCDGGGGGGCD